MGDSAQASLEEFAEILGWSIATEEKKRAPPATRFVALGVEFDLEGAHRGLVVVRNRPGRVDEIAAAVEEALSLGLTPARAASLRGRLSYAAHFRFQGLQACKMAQMKSTALPCPLNEINCPPNPPSIKLTAPPTPLNLINCPPNPQQINGIPHPTQIYPPPQVKRERGCAAARRAQQPSQSGRPRAWRALRRRR